MPTPKAKPSNDRVGLYDKLIATNPEIERKGDANPCGNMFTLLHQHRLAIRLPEDERENFLKKRRQRNTRQRPTERGSTKKVS